MNARREAWERLEGRYDPRVLEPSPPYVPEPPWFADDPVTAGPLASEAIVTPVDDGHPSWSDLAADDPDLALWCSERWLGAWARIGPPPQTLTATRRSLHAVAEQVLAPARRAATGRIGLRYTRRGFGTPFFGRGRQIRIEAGELVVDHGEMEERSPLSTLREAAAFVGIECGPPEDLYEPATSRAQDAALEVDRDAAAWLGDWFGSACALLEQLRADAGSAGQPSRVQLWPEHFDIAVELSDPAATIRAGFGASPGDGRYERPYLYVAPWSPCEGQWWNATHFNGALLDLQALLEASDQRAAALEFFRTSQRVLADSAAGEAR